MRKHKYNRICDLIWWVLLCSSCMGIMLFFAAGKTITIENIARDSGELTEMVDTIYADSEYKGISLNLQEDSQDMRIRIPIEKGMKADMVTMENRYMDKELWIYIQGGDLSFYNDPIIYGDISQVKAGYFEILQDGVLLKFLLNEVYEYVSILENDCMYIDLKKPRELYQQIVVVDPGFSEDNESALLIAQSLKKRMEKSDVKFYFTNMENQDIPIEKRAALANELQADMFIGISFSRDKDKEKYGTLCLYNDSYFIPGLGNIELADILVRNVVTAISGRALGLEAASEESVLSFLKIPAAVIKAGYLTHAIEGELLQKQEYIDLIAQGIEAAVKEAYE